MVFGTAGPLQAQAQPAPLVGENLFGAPASVEADCDPTGTSTISWTVEGVAAGPYPGTFRETGTATIGPQDEPPTRGSFFNTGIVSDLQVSFTIFSGDTTITGTKTLRPPGPTNFLGPSQGSCQHVFGSLPLVGTICSEAEQQILFAELLYEATISSPTGTTTDRGVSLLDLNRTAHTCAVPFDPAFHVDLSSVYEDYRSTPEPLSTPGLVTGGGQIGATSTGPGTTFALYAKGDGTAVRGNCTVQDHTGSVKVKCLDATVLAVSGTHATFSGTAEVNGVPTTYTIDVDDLSEPGVGGDTFKIVTGTGYSAAGVVSRGNIQIHRER